MTIDCFEFVDRDDDLSGSAPVTKSSPTPAKGKHLNVDDLGFSSHDTADTAGECRNTLKQIGIAVHNARPSDGALTDCAGEAETPSVVGRIEDEAALDVPFDFGLC